MSIGTVHYGFISRDRRFLPDSIQVTEHEFFFCLLGVPARGDEEMVGDCESRQPGGEFESTEGSVQVKDHERWRSIFHEPLTCWRITGSGYTTY